MAKHDFYTDEYGNVDSWRLSEDYHNGPQCRRCESVWCEHCEPERWNEDCPNDQLDIPFESMVE